MVIAEPKAYLAALKEHYVLADAQERRAAIWQQIQELARGQDAQVQQDERLLAEVVNLVEYPTAFKGVFSGVLAVPAEVLITSMKEHQRYFPSTMPRAISKRASLACATGPIITWIW